MKKLLKKREAGALPMTNDDDDFENFLLATRMRKCFYNETQNILGNTYGMCVLQVIILSLFFLFEST
jgi:N-acetyltransferase 10